ncbi:cation:proton antiporter [Halovivax gelatinilyticus]|uniref:cation:proton antiporter n=1 Tax=Halovivax gelatinilyticus TaxID=2961597 RepID=UPI0020CA9028|nr:cation:proton antiporter [Halovivax gelatinilyticus]
MAEDVVVTLAIVFVTAGLLSLVANHFGLPPIPFYVIAGLLTGRFVDDPDVIQLALWGIAFLVFVFGIRVDFAAIRSVLRDGEVAAISQLLVVGPLAFVIGYGLSIVFGFSEPVLNGVFFAVAATLSSTIVGGGLLEREIRDNLVHGRLASSIHFFDDLVAVGVLLILSADAFTAELVTSKIGYGVAFLVAALLIYRHGFPLLLRLTGDSDELVLMSSISILIAFIAAAEFVGISIVVGAFAAGIAVRADDARTLGVRNGIESIRDFFVAIFFVTVGALVSVPTVETLVLSGILCVLVLTVNPLVMVLAFIYEGYDARTSFLTATSLNQVSELALVVAIQAIVLEHLSIATAMFDAIILAAAVTMILTAVTRKHEQWLYATIVERLARYRRTTKIDDRSEVRDELTDHVVIVGYGRHGRLLVDACEEHDVGYAVIENDPARWDELRTECRNYVLGDAMSAYPWEVARLEDAALVISTVDHRPVSEAVLDVVPHGSGEGGKHLDRIAEPGPSTDVILRAETAGEARELLEQGATFVNVPSVLAGDQLVEVIGVILAEETDRETIREAHQETLTTLERYGFGSRIAE